MPPYVKDFDDFCIERLKKNPKLVEATLIEAINQFFLGDIDTTRFHLNNYIKVTMGINKLSKIVNKDNKLITKKLARNGKPTRNEILNMFGAIQQHQGITIEGKITKKILAKKKQPKILSKPKQLKPLTSSYKSKLRSQSKL